MNIDPHYHSQFHPYDENQYHHMRAPYDTCSLLHYTSSAFATQRDQRGRMRVRKNVFESL